MDPPAVAARYGITVPVVQFLPPDLSLLPIPPETPPEERVSPESYDPKIKLEAAVIAEACGTTAAQRRIKQGYGFLVPRSTIGDWLKKLKLFKSQNPSSPPSVEIFTCAQPRGAPSLLGTVLDTTLLYFLTEARSAGSCVNAAIVVAVAYGIVLFNCPHLLPQFGGPIKLTTNWAKQWLRGKGWVKRKATTGHRHIPQDYQQLKDTFLKRVNNTILTHNIPAPLVVNFDQTGINLLPTQAYTMAPKGSDQVPIAHKDDKRQITGVFAGSAAGHFLPPQLLYQGI